MARGSWYHQILHVKRLFKSVVRIKIVNDECVELLTTIADSGKTRGLNPSVWGQIGVSSIALREGLVILPVRRKTE